MKRYFLFILFCFPLGASEHEIELTGKITISVKNGTFDGDVQLKNIPKLDDYLIHLNSGLNIQYIRNEQADQNYSFRKTFNADYSEESFGYILSNDKISNQFTPDTLQFKYTGKFPVVSDLSKASDNGDWKGNIAFNGKHIRTDGFQAAWYPIVYEIHSGKRYDEVRYDIEVVCADCQSIYVNGSEPISSTSGTFKSDTPRSVMLFAGSYDFTQYKNNYHLNTGLSDKQALALEKLTSSYIHYYEDKLSLSYGGSITYIQTAPTTKNDSYYFVVYPSIVAMTHEGGFTNLKANWFKGFIAHELAHYYFGTYKKFNSELGDMFTESFAEFLAFKAIESIQGSEVYRDRLRRFAVSLGTDEFITFADLKQTLDAEQRERYVYTYAPIIWLAIEHEIGQANMWLLLNKILTTDTTFTDYQFLLEMLRLVLQDDEKLTHLVETYFTNSHALQNAKDVLL